MPQRVALDVSPLLRQTTGEARYTGVARYTSELAAALELRGVEIHPYAVALRGEARPGTARWRFPARAMHFLWRRAGAPTLERLVGVVDVVHATNFVLPALSRTPGVVTVHDLSFLREDAFPGAGRLRDMVPHSVRRAARVLVPSDSVADEVRERYSLPEERVTVTHEGVAPVFFGATPLSDATLSQLGITKPFALAVGTIEPRKNLARLVTAWTNIRSQIGEWSLVIAGPKGWGPALEGAPGVVLLGWVGDETLPGLLAASELFCYPSLYEGFGLPPLEAMATGTAVLAGSYAAAREVLGDAAVLVDSNDTDAIAAGLLRLASDEAERRSIALAGRARATRFTWEAAAGATIAAYGEILEERGRS